MSKHPLQENYERIFGSSLTESKGEEFFGDLGINLDHIPGDTVTFDLISPDGITITPEPFTAKKSNLKSAIKKAYKEWADPILKSQGYYSSNKEKIAPEDLPYSTLLFIHLPEIGDLPEMSDWPQAYDTAHHDMIPNVISAIK